MPELWGLKSEKEWSKNSVTIASHCYNEDTRVLATCLDKKKKKKKEKKPGRTVEINQVDCWKVLGTVKSVKEQYVSMEMAEKAIALYN